MKKLSKRTLPVLLLAACLILVAASCSSWDWSLKYSKTAQVGNMEFGLNPEGKEAFVAVCLWDGTEEGRRFVIPDTVEGCTVFKMGGYFGRGLPMPFYIAAESDELPTAAAAGSGESSQSPESAAGTSEGTESAGSTETAESAGTAETAGTPETVIIEEEFLYTVVIGPYLIEISNVMDSSDFLRVQEDGTVILCHPVFAFEVDEKNPAFYAEDGKLYTKKGNVLVTDFNYPSGK